MRGIIALPMLSVIDSNVIEIESKGALQNGMSLFQDLKLKRRKVDSRCSSDGESIGTSDSTSSLSPDASSQTQSEGSPKEKDRCITPEELVAPVSSKPFPQQFFFMMKPDGRSKVAYDSFLNNNNNSKHLHHHHHHHLPPHHHHQSNGVIKLNSNVNGNNNNNNHQQEPPQQISVKSEPVEEQMKGRERSSPDKNNENTSGSPGGGHCGSDNESVASPSSGISSGESSVSIKREKEDKYFQKTNNTTQMNDEKDMDLSMDKDRGKFSPPLSRPGSSSPNGGGKNESTLIITKSSKEVINGMNGMNGSRIPSPPSHNNTENNNNGIQQHPQPPMSHQPHSNHLHARLTGQDLTPRPMTVPSPMVHVEMRNNIPEKADPISVVTSTSLSFHHHSMYRINGVRPEVISGGAVTPGSNNNNNNNNQSNGPGSNCNNNSNGSNNNNQSPGPHSGPQPQSRKSPPLSNHSRSPNSSPSNSSCSGSIINGMHSPGQTIVAGGSLGMSSSNVSSNHHHHVNLNRTPTVIMGEAGGVRTMLWSQPGQTLPPPVDLGAPPITNGHGMSNGYPTQNPPPPPNNNISSNNNNNNNNINNNCPPTTNHQKGTLSMERLWASEALNLSTSPNGNFNSSNGSHLNGNSNVSVTPLNHVSNGHGNGSHPSTNPDDDDYEQPMICMICEDRATGLHYGIITCEGCKGFFKRTVQNRRVYTCVADGTCEITKAQRNRCQYCRFKKCIEQGMVLQAVREDRMPGGRNSGAVYNLYKVPVKYRKHKKGNRVAAGKAEKAMPPQNNNNNQPPPPVLNGNILKNALTSPNESAHFRQQMPFDQAAAMITHLVQCDNFHDIAALQNWDELLEARGDLSDKLCQMGDSIVYRLVQWTKRLPFYQELPVDVHTRVLTHKWHELLVLTTSAWQAMHTPGPPPNMSAEEETTESLQVLQRCLQAMMGRSLTVEQLRQDVGQMVERLTYLTRAFRRMGIRIEEYVCLKVITMLQTTGTRSPEVGVIQERYIKCLRTFVETTCNGHPNRLNDLLRTLHEVQAAAALLLESKMFYVPFLLNSALLQR